MNITRTCDRCGKVVPAHAPENLCLGCLFDTAVDPDTDTPGGFGPANTNQSAEQTTPPSMFGDYELLGELGRGGQGVVFRARHRGLGRLVALKTIPPAHLAGAHARERFRLEASTASRLDHPNIVPIYEVGERDGFCFYSMKLVEGTTIQQLASRELPDAAACRHTAAILVKVAQAVYHAHQRGVLHRDLKPSNVLLDHEHEPHVSDFGLARWTDEDSSLTVSQALIGTPAYLAPEVATGGARQATVAADIYGLGAMLYQLLAGRPPFAGATVAETLRAVQDAEPARPGKINPAVPADLETICLKCLEKEPAKRYGTAQELADDLGRLHRDEPIHARPVTRLEQAMRWCRRKPSLASSLLAILILLLIVIVGSPIAFYRINHQRQRAEKGESDARKSELAARQQAYASDMNLVQRALEDGNYGLARRALEAHRAAPGQPDLRGFEWRHFWKLSQSESLKTWHGHSNFVTCVAVSPNGKMLASGSLDGSIRLWDLASGRVTTLSVNAGAVNSVAFSPDGGFLAAGSYTGPAQLWELASGRVIKSFDGVEPWVCFSPVQELLAVSSGPAGVTSSVSVWDCARLQRIRTFTNSGSRAAFSPDGQILASGSRDGAIKLWDIATGQLLQALTNSGAVISLAFSPHGQRLVASNFKREVLFWDLATGQRSTLLSGHTSRVWNVAFSPDGQTLATASADHSVGLWDGVSQRSKGRLQGHGGAVEAVAFLPDGKRLVSASDDETLKLWSLEPKEETERIADHLVLSPSYDTLVLQGRPHGIGFGVFVFSEDGLRLAAPGESGVNVWDLATKKVLAIITNEVRALALTDGGRTLVTINTNYVLRFWDWESQLLRTNFVLSTTDEPIRTAQLAPDGKVLATANRHGLVSFWNPATGSSLGAIQAHRSMVWWLAFSPDGTLLATSSSDRTARIIDVKTQSEMATLSPHRDAVYDVAFSGDGRLLATASGDGAKLWKVSTGEMITTLIGHKEEVHGVAFAPDSRMLSTADAHTLKLWHLATYRELATFRTDSEINHLAFSTRGHKLAAAQMDGSLRLWSAPTLAEIDANSDWSPPPSRQRSEIISFPQE